MRPKVIMHNQVSLDLKLTGFPVDMGTYYGIAGEFGAQAAITGSNTILAATEEFPPEKPSDFVKPEINPDDTSGYMIIVDSRGRVRSHHVMRRFEMIKDVIVLVSRSTPKEYLEYLGERNYDYIQAGEDKVNLASALETLNERYGFDLIRSDAGTELNSVLLEKGLIDRISLLISPVLVGGDGIGMFDNLDEGVELKLESSTVLEGGVVHTLYDVRY